MRFQSPFLRHCKARQGRPLMSWNGNASQAKVLSKIPTGKKNMCCKAGEMRLSRQASAQKLYFKDKKGSPSGPISLF